MLEAGIGNFEITAWFGFMAPASTSPALIQKISSDIARVVAMPDIQERILSQASEPVGGTPEQYAAFIRAEQAKWREVVKLANMTAD
jgi:tripartite-type tricarboxylate transporter receptor subunit TctC